MEKKKEYPKDDLAIEERPLTLTNANNNETKSNQGQNNCTSLLAPSNTENGENVQLVGGSDENGHNNDGLEIVEVERDVEADEDSKTEKKHRGLDAKEMGFNAIVELELKEIGNNSRAGTDAVPSEATVVEDIVEDEIVKEEIAKDDIAKEEIVNEETVQDEIVGDEIAEGAIIEEETVENEIVGYEIAEDEIVEEESEEEGEHQTDILTPALSLLIFNITMPCVDFYFDASLIRILFFNNWGCLFVLVCALAANFLFTSFAWWSIEPKSQKAWSWIFLVLQIWPQLKAVQVNLSIYHFYTRLSVKMEIKAYFRPSGWC